MKSIYDTQKIFGSANLRISITAADLFGRLKCPSSRSGFAIIKQPLREWLKSEDFTINDAELRYSRGCIFKKNRTEVLTIPYEWGVALLVDLASYVSVSEIIELTISIWKQWINQHVSDENELSAIRVQTIHRKVKKTTIFTNELSGDVSTEQIESIIMTTLDELNN